VEDYAGGDADLVLGVAGEARDEVVHLDGANPEVRNEFQVDAGTEGGGEGGVAGTGNGVVGKIGRDRIGSDAGTDGLVGGTEENMGERGDARGKRDFRAEEIGVLVYVARITADGRAVMAAEIGGDTEEGKKTIGAGKFPAVEVLPVGDKAGCNDGKGADLARRASLDFLGGDGRTEIGVAAEDDEIVLSEEGRRREGEGQKSKKNGEESEHEFPPRNNVRGV
jgi:hypothetical protein